jgi:uncharacterized caspase-like protein
MYGLFEPTDGCVVDLEASRDRPAGLPLRQALLGFRLLVGRKLRLPAKAGAALARCHPAIVGPLQDALPLVLGQRREKGNQPATDRIVRLRCGLSSTLIMARSHGCAQQWSSQPIGLALESSAEQCTVAEILNAGNIMRLLLGALWFLLSIAVPGQALADKRVALVIGNSAYQHTSKLANPRNDAADMAAALKKHGFHVVEGLDLDKAAFDRKVRDFAGQLQNAAVGVFFYAGHGLQVAGQNYLVPTDAELTTAAALDFEMVRLDVVHRVMERQASTNVIFLDACRDNPLARNLARAMGTRSAEVGRGLAAVESGVGTLISFSTQPGNVALDGSGRNSPFAAALVKELGSTKDDLSSVLIAVRNDVMKQTQRKQVPWEHSALTGRFYFSPAEPTAPPPPVSTSRLSEPAEAWAQTKDNASIPVLEAFIHRFGDTYYGDLAKVRLADLKQAEAMKAAAKKKADDDALARVESERQRVALLQQEEQKKHAAALVAAEAAKEAAKQKANALALARTLQTELRRVGCDPGNVDGKWDGKTKGALNDFARLTKISLPSDEPTDEAFNAVVAKQGRICPLRCAAGHDEVGGKCVAKIIPKAPKTSGSEKVNRNSNEKQRLCYTAGAAGTGVATVPCNHPLANPSQRAN